MKPDQLPLAIRWPAQQRFDSFFVGENEATVALLRAAATQAGADWIFLGGPAAAGKTHLLIAVCAAAGEVGRSAQYIALRHLPPQGDIGSAIRALGGSELLAIDDVDAIAGQRTAEHALFDLYNRCKVDKTTLLFSAARIPGQAGFALPDLTSRLSSCTQVHLKSLTDEQRREVLRQRALSRGIELDDTALDWLFARVQRDLTSLTVLLDRLDSASLAAKRRITVPFLRQLIDP